MSLLICGTTCIGTLSRSWLWHCLAGKELCYSTLSTKHHSSLRSSSQADLLVLQVMDFYYALPCLFYCWQSGMASCGTLLHSRFLEAMFLINLRLFSLVRLELGGLLSLERHYINLSN